MFELSSLTAPVLARPFFARPRHPQPALPAPRLTRTARPCPFRLAAGLTPHLIPEHGLDALDRHDVLSHKARHQSGDTPIQRTRTERDFVRHRADLAATLETHPHALVYRLDQVPDAARGLVKRIIQLARHAAFCRSERSFHVPGYAGLAFFSAEPPAEGDVAGSIASLKARLFRQVPAREALSIREPAGAPAHPAFLKLGHAQAQLVVELARYVGAEAEDTLAFPSPSDGNVTYVAIDQHLLAALRGVEF